MIIGFLSIQGITAEINIIVSREETNIPESGSVSLNIAVVFYFKPGIGIDHMYQRNSIGGFNLE